MKFSFSSKKRGFLGQKGFSMVEMALYISLSAIVVWVASEMMRSHLDAYSFITSRESALADVRYAMSRMNYELLRVETADLITIDDESIQFIDDDGNPASFTLGPSGTGQGLFRNNELLLFPVASFQMRYYDQNNQPTAVIADVRKMEITLATQAVGNEGNITLTSAVIPRNFIYENYQ